MDQILGIKNEPLAAPGLAINGAGLLVPKITNLVASKIDGSIYVGVAAAALGTLVTAVPALAIDQSVIVAVCLSKAGVYTYVAGKPYAATAALLKDAAGNTALAVNWGDNIPQPTVNTSLMGWIIISTDHTHTFTGGTTALDAAGITVTYIDNFGIYGR